MAKYILDTDLSDGCWNCPCEGEGWRCNAAGYRELPIGGSLPDNYIPEWCPLEPVREVEPAFCVNDSCLGRGLDGDRCNITGATVKPSYSSALTIKKPEDCPLEEISMQSTYQIEFDFKHDSNWCPDPKCRRFDDLARAVGEAVLEQGRGKFGDPPAIRVVEESVLPEKYRSRVAWQMREGGDGNA